MKTSAPMHRMDRLELFVTLLATSVLPVSPARAETASAIQPLSCPAVVTASDPGADPPAPEQASPPDGATGIATVPTFRWNDVAGATAYRLQVGPYLEALSLDDSSLCSSCAINTVTGTPAVAFPDSPLLPGVRYWWQVRAFSSDSGQSGAWSAVGSFTTQLGQSSTVLVLTSPSEDAEGVPLTAHLGWSIISPATRYVLQIFDETTDPCGIMQESLECSGCLVDGVASSYALELKDVGLSTERGYCWRVFASLTDSTADPAVSEIQHFNTNAHPSLDTPLLITPFDGTSVPSGPILFQWTTVGGAETYRIETAESPLDLTPDYADVSYCTDREPACFSDKLVLPCFSANRFLVGHTYYWHVRAGNSSSEGRGSYWSSIWRFTVVPVPDATSQDSSPACTCEVSESADASFTSQVTMLAASLLALLHRKRRSPHSHTSRYARGSRFTLPRGWRKGLEARGDAARRATRAARLRGDY